MTKLDEAMIRMVEHQRLGFVATVAPDGTPNVSPKGTVSVLDRNRLVFADINSPGTIANLRLNPAVEVNVVDPFIRKGFRFKGVAQLHESGREFDRLLGFFEERGLFDAPRRIRVIVVIDIDDVAPLISPGYDVEPDESIVREQWTRHYLGTQKPPDPR